MMNDEFCTLAASYRTLTRRLARDTNTPNPDPAKLAVLEPAWVDVEARVRRAVGVNRTRLADGYAFTVFRDRGLSALEVTQCV
jgi:hypothetical protein